MQLRPLRPLRDGVRSVPKRLLQLSVKNVGTVREEDGHPPLALAGTAAGPRLLFWRRSAVFPCCPPPGSGLPSQASLLMRNILATNNKQQ